MINRWGIIGLGKIANLFAADLLLSDNSILHGVASRSIEKAKSFKDNFSSQKYYGSYEELAKDPEIDIIYVATPHTFHFENTMMCLKNGKSVLCEKPMGINSDEVRAMIKEAQSQKLFLMEAIWTRFIPASEKLLELLDHKVIGDLVHLRADFGFNGDKNPEGRVYNKSLGGGSLMDVGIYPIYLSLATLGIPTEIKAMARMTDSDVDSFCSMQFRYKNGAIASLESSIESKTPTEACIYGSKGHIKIHNRFHHSEKLSIFDNVYEKTLDIEYQGNGYLHEIEEVNKCLANQEMESNKLPLQTSLDLITIMDRVKEQIGLRYK